MIKEINLKLDEHIYNKFLKKCIEEKVLMYDVLRNFIYKKLEKNKK